ncbi:oligosaccharide flippase family protein [Nitrincola iocasae]|nr:oligosaccharide flippase family protein [Nitrincola iocasae]
MPSSDISKKQVNRASIWITLGHFSSQGIRLLSNLVLTRILAPEMFGVMALVFTIITALNMMTDLGIKQAVVQNKKGDNDLFLKAAWTMQVIHGVVVSIFLLVFGMIMLIYIQPAMVVYKNAYAHPDLPIALIIMAIVPVITGFNSIKIAQCSRKVQLGKLVLIELLAAISGIAVMLVYAQYSTDILVLIYGSIVSALVKMALSHLYLSGVSIGFAFNKELFKEIYTFGKWIVVSSVMGFLINSGDKLILGIWITSSALGFYSIAVILASFIKQLVEKFISTLFFPMLSSALRKLDDKNDIKPLYYSIRFKVDTFCCFSAGFIYGISDLLISVLYDERYQDVSAILKILSFGCIWIGFQLAGQLLLADGKSKKLSSIAFFQALSLYLFMPLAYYLFGFYGAVWAVALNPFIRFLVSSYYMKKLFFFDVYKEARGLVFYPVGALLAYFITITTSNFI